MNPVNHTNFRLRQLSKAYYIAKSVVIDEGFAWEIDWQYAVSLNKLDEPIFLGEAAWVILNSGMRESVVKRKFPGVSQAFFDWQSSQLIMTYADTCRMNALRYFRHTAKIEAILTIAKHVNEHGIKTILEQISENGVVYLQQFPYMGPATSLHLAKNIGLPLAKPDRHLLRIAKSFGYERVQDLCEDISLVTDEPVPVIDLVLWRYATKHQRQIARFTDLFNRRLSSVAS